MSQMLSAKLRRVGPEEGHTTGSIAHWCPGCGHSHSIAIEGPNYSGAKWTWDGNVDSPTFSPSVNIRWGRQADPKCDVEGGVCHYFIKAGKIEFLGDCTHALSGQTVDLPDLPIRKE